MFRRRNLRANTAALLAGNVGSLGLSFALSVMIGRVLGEDGLGVYASVLAWIFPLLMLAEFGTNTLMTRDLAGDTGRTRVYLSGTARIRVVFGGILAALLVVGAPTLSDSPAVIAGLRVAAPLLLIEPTYGAYTAVFRAHRAMLPIPALNVGMLAAQVLLTAFVLWRGGGVVWVVVVNTVTSAGRMLAGWGLYRASRRDCPPDVKLSLAPRTLLARALPFAVAGVLAASHMRLNIVLLEVLAGTAAVGVFAAGMRFVEATRAVPGALFDALMPQLTALADNPAALGRTFRRSAGVIVVFSAGVGVGAWLFGGLLVRVTYGPAFEASGQVLAVAGCVLAPALLRQLRVLYAYALGREATVNRVLLLMLGVGTVGGVVLVARYGAVGAVLAWGLAESVGLVVLWASVRPPVERAARLDTLPPDAGTFRQHP